MVKKHQVYKRTKVDLLKHLKKTHEYGIAGVDPRKRKTMEKLLVRAFEMSILTPIQVPGDTAWGDKVDGMQAFACSAKFWSICVPPFASIEARYVVEGSMLFAGLPLDVIPGDGLKQKRQALYDMGAEKMAELIEASGWIGAVEEGNVIIVPTGFMVISCCRSTTSHGFRWMVEADNNNTHRTIASLEQLIETNILNVVLPHLATRTSWHI